MRVSRIVAAVMVLLFTAAAAGSVVAVRVSGGEMGELLSLAFGFTAFFVVGIAIVVRRPRHPIGWLFAGAGLYATVQAALAGLGEVIMEEGGPSTLYLVGNIGFSWPVLLGTLVVFVPLLFPTGRVPSPRWRWVAWVAGGVMVLMQIGAVFQRSVCVTYDENDQCLRQVSNPLGVAWVQSPEDGAVGSVLFLVLVVCLVGAGLSVVARYRRATGLERAQLRWFTFAVAIFLGFVVVVGVVMEEMLDAGVPEIPFGIDPFGLVLSLIPVSVGIALLRHRLYDIDRLISRTVSYGIVSAFLVVAYVLSVFLLRQVFPASNELAVAGSTLAVAVAFNPLRRRIQEVVDRRFDRSRFDGVHVVEEFTAHLRTETSLSDVSHSLMVAAQATMQPATLSIWMRPRP